ncbi:hypothetical protein [Streptomyces sp. MMG1533]|uniref:hypothetical protein n=1 Tax=Streptomyces sp. MMG1533 TaxID=1415546 RepID=UPI0018FEA90F|nr:hypothetical protein [Streptomyces sp. MMG1533]
MNSRTEPATSPRRPHLPRLSWVLPVTANLVLGVVAVVPLWLLMQFARNYPLAALGLTGREPTDNDGMLPWALLLVPMWAVFLGLWISVNLLMRERTGASTGRYWGWVVVVVLAPTGVLAGVLGL